MFFIFVVLPGIPFIPGVVGFVVFTFFPGDFSGFSPKFPNNPATDSVTPTHIEVVIHGKDSNPEQMQAIISFGNICPDETRNNYRLFPDWSHWAGNFLRVSLNSFHLGQIFGEQLANTTEATSVHLISHSAGAFFAYGACQAIREKNSDIRIQATYLAPLSIKHLFQRDFGTRHFGSCADFSDSYYDEEDDVPGASKPLFNAFSFNVTALRATCRLNPCKPHLSPVYWYGQALTNHLVPVLNSGEEILNLYPKGGVSIVNSIRSGW